MASPRIDQPGYTALHYRLRRDKGDPDEFDCIECGEVPAAEWAYTHDDPEELTDPKGRTYSVKPEHYVPMCISCHRRFDNRDSCRKGHLFTPENTYEYRGYRLCRTCRLAAMRAYYERKRR